MKIAGVICEYNPFHFGHKFQLDLIKEQFGGIICVMSGSFVQRGEAAVFDKWTRAEAAVLNGADLVLELPVRYCLSSAQDFAKGGVEILSATGVTDALCFGSECADTERLSRAAEIMAKETPETSQKIRSLLKTGISYPAARAQAFSGFIDNEIIESPNNILGLEYINAIKSSGSTIKPIALPRKSVGHDDNVISGIYASATRIRQILEAGGDISSLTPFDFSTAVKYNTDRLGDIFRYNMIMKGEGAFDGIRDIEPGLASRFVKYSGIGTFSGIAASVKTKRYTLSRLKRIALCSIMGITGSYKPPQYLRILAMNDCGRKILADMRKKARLPIVNKAADFKDDSINEDIRATDIAALCAETPMPSGRDFTVSPVYIRKNRE